jgi:hypothetical protein
MEATSASFRRPLRVAAGYRPLTTQIYPRGGEKEIVSDIVPAPLK